MPWYSEAELLPIVETLDIDELTVFFKDVKVNSAYTGATGIVKNASLTYRGECIFIEWDHHYQNSSLSIEDEFYRDKPYSVMFLIPEDRMTRSKNGFYYGDWWPYKENNT